MTERTILSLVIVRTGPGIDFDAWLNRLLANAGGEGVQGIIVEVGAADDARMDGAYVAEDGTQIDLITTSDADIAHARRIGLSRAIGQWVMFSQVGDEILGGGLSAVVEDLRSCPSDASCVVIPPRPQWRKWWRSGRVADRPGTLGDAATSMLEDITSLVLRRAEVPLDGSALDSRNDRQLVTDLLAHAPRSQLTVATKSWLKTVTSLGVDAQTRVFRSSASHYFSLLRAIATRLEEPPIPLWAARLLAADLTQLVRMELSQETYIASMSAEELEEFVQQLRALVVQFDTSDFEVLGDPRPYDEVRDYIRALRGVDEGMAVAHIVDVDERVDMMQIRYSATRRSDEQIRVGVEDVTPEVTKWRSMAGFGEQVLLQRILWVPAISSLTLDVEGRDVPLYFTDGTTLDRGLRVDGIRGNVRRARERPAALVTGLKSRSWLVWHSTALLARARRGWMSRAALIRLLAHLPVFSRRFANAWMLMDRADIANDNAEHFYRWLKENHPEVNAWFVVRPDVPDFKRLEQEGFKLVAYGSTKHHLLMYHAREYLSSQLGLDVSRPISDRYLQRNPPWRFTFLQHGVIHNDLSRWMNTQQFRFCIATTHAEYQSLVSDGTPYTCTAREVQLTGMPRFDRLRKLADDRNGAERREIVVAPTWRNGLLAPVGVRGSRRNRTRESVESDFVKGYVRLLSDERLRLLVDDGYRITFLPHPNAESLFADAPIPLYVSVGSYEGIDLQSLLTSARLFVTDYSSIAFDARFVNTPVLYFRPDSDGIYGVAHTIGRDRFTNIRSVRGPIFAGVESFRSVFSVDLDSLESGLEIEDRKLFAYWDQRASERIYRVLHRAW